MNNSHETPDALPPAVEQLLLDIVADGFMLYCCGTRADPNALLASYDWGSCIDIATIRDFDQVAVARVPKCGKVDLFAPELVVWAFEGPAESALQALLNLVHPHHPHAPTTPYSAPRSMHIPRHEQRPLTIRPPAPGKAGTRAARLAAAATTESTKTESTTSDDPASIPAPDTNSASDGLVHGGENG